MSAISKTRGRRRDGRPAEPRADDPRVVRSRTAIVAAARTLFLRDGYAGTTMEEIAAQAGLSRRTVYNNYVDKDALFTQIVAEVTAYAEAFARGLHEEFTVGVTATNLHARLDDLGRRLALGIVRPEVIAMRRLLIGETRAFPALAAEYFDRAPGQVLKALASGFAHLGRAGLLQVTRAAPPSSSPISSPARPSTARCWSARSRPRRKSSPARARACRPSSPATEWAAGKAGPTH